MSVQQPAAAPHSVGLGVAGSSIEDRPWHRIGLGVDLRTTLPGLVELDAASDHLLRIHAGPPVRGGCRSERFFYTRGDIDLFPAGVSACDLTRSSASPPKRFGGFCDGQRARAGYQAAFLMAG